MSHRYKFIDLFAGAGGFHVSFKPFADCVFVAEWDRYAQQTYELNHISDNKPFKVADDITKVCEFFIPGYDILCGGFPCQPFSIAGTKTGFEHKQGNLFFDIIRILDITQPPVIFLENVKNLVSHDDGKTMEVVTEELTKLGYKLKIGVFNSTKFGNLPHNRERIYIVGFKNQKMADHFEFPEQIPLTTRIFGDIIDLTKKAPAKYYQTNKTSQTVQRMHDEITEKYVIYQSRRSYIRANKSGNCPCLTANMGTGGHNVPLILDDFGVRKLTPKECFALQGFPPDFQFPDKLSDRHLYKQAGNSIPLGVVQRIAKSIINVMDKVNKPQTVQISKYRIVPAPATGLGWVAVEQWSEDDERYMHISTHRTPGEAENFISTLN
jgi:DNA (cytosine-5)-methyltransferase 1